MDGPKQKRVWIDQDLIDSSPRCSHNTQCRMYFIAILFLSLLNELITRPHVNYLHKIIMHIVPKGYVTTKVTCMLLIKLNQILTYYVQKKSIRLHLHVN